MSASEDQTFDSALAEDLEQLEYYSHGDHVEVAVSSVVSQGGDAVTVQFDPPVGDAFVHEMTVPRDPAEETEFTALLRTCGYNYTTAEEIVGDRVPARYGEDGWEMLYDAPKRSVQERVTKLGWRWFGEKFFVASVVTAGMLAWPVIGLGLVVAAIADDEKAAPSVGLAVIGYAILVTAWLLLVLTGQAAYTAVTGGGPVVITFPGGVSS